MVLRYLFGNWLRQKAHETVRDKVSEAVRGQHSGAADGLNGEAPEGREAEPPPCEVGFVFALGIEAGGLEDLLEQVTTIRGHGFTARRGKLAGRNVVLIRCGVGRDRAARATEALIDGHRPQWVVSAGFAGGLSPDLKRHDLLMVDNLADPDGNHLAVDLKVDAEALSQMPNVHVGRLVTADRVICLPDEKLALGKAHQALAVDMESFSVAEVCRRRKVRFLGFRIISDPADEELPADLLRITQQKTNASLIGAAMGAVFKRPASVKDMYRLKENALVAADRLAKFLRSTIDQLVPPTK